MERFAVGDIVRFHRGEYSHVAIYSGQGRVIHLWSPSDARSFSVRIDSIRHVQNCQRTDEELLSSLDNDDDNAADPHAPQLYTEEMDVKMRRRHDVEPFNGEEVVRRARTRLGESRYDYLTYNCEHFVTWARYGVGASPQATSHTNQVIAGALLGAAVGGIAGLVVGGAISFFSKMNALSVSSGGVSSGATLEETSSSDVDDSESSSRWHDAHEDSDGDQHDRRLARERLLENISAMQLEEDGSLGEFEAWAEARHQSRVQANARAYSDDRHNALASRLADDKLLCGICFYDLQLTRAVAFPCDHFTCNKCFDALVTNATGHKCCPYCRMNITQVQAIHRSTKQAARSRLAWELETIHSSTSAAPSM